VIIMPPSVPVPQQVEALASALHVVKPFRCGTLLERRVKCSKPGCPCGHDPEARHGPYFSFTRIIHGRSSSRYVSTEEAAVIRRQIEAGRAFRKQMKELWEACEGWADEELAVLTSDRDGAVEKGGSRRRSPRRLRPRSPG
jgi:hypothetical protein